MVDKELLQKMEAWEKELSELAPAMELERLFAKSLREIAKKKEPSKWQ